MFGVTGVPIYERFREMTNHLSGVPIYPRRNGSHSGCITNHRWPIPRE